MTNPPVCAHAADPDPQCHRTALLTCPDHFNQLSADAISAVAVPHDPVAFIRAVRHLAVDQNIPSAWFTWLAMMARWCAPPGAPRKEVSDWVVAVTQRAAAAGDYPNDPTVAALLRTGVLAALNGDPDNAEAALHAAEATLDTRGLMSLLGSLAASVAFSVVKHPDATIDRVFIHQIAGSQIFSAAGMVALPHLADAIDAARTGDAGDGLLDAVDRLAAVDRPGVVVAGVSMAAQLLGQVLDPETTLLAGSADDTYDPADVMGTVPDVGILDWRTATEQNASEGLMTGVWAMRAADAYAGAASRRDMVDRFQAVMEANGDVTKFTYQVLIGCTQMLGNSIATNPRDWGARPPGDHPIGRG